MIKFMFSTPRAHEQQKKFVNQSDTFFLLGKNNVTTAIQIIFFRFFCSNQTHRKTKQF